MNPGAIVGGAIILIILAGSIIYTRTFDSVMESVTPPVIIVSPTPELSNEASAAASPLIAQPALTESSKPKASAVAKASSSPSTPAVSNVHIEGLQPFHVPFGSTAKLNGKGFGAKKGSITYYYWEGKQISESEIVSWDDGHISYVNHFPVANIGYEVEVKTADGKVSNRFKTESGTGEPLPTIFVLNPSNPVPGSDATIKGINLKNADKVYFYEEDKSYIGQDIGTSGILEHLRDEEIRYNMPGNLQPGKRYKMSVMSKYGTYGGLMSFTAGN